MLAKADRLLVAVGRDMTHSDDGHFACLLGRRLHLCAFERIAKKCDSEVATDSDQLLLNNIQKLVKSRR